MSLASEFAVTVSWWSLLSCPSMVTQICCFILYVCWRVIDLCTAKLCLFIAAHIGSWIQTLAAMSSPQLREFSIPRHCCSKSTFSISVSDSSTMRHSFFSLKKMAHLPWKAWGGTETILWPSHAKSTCQMCHTESYNIIITYHVIVLYWYIAYKNIIYSL